jgi:valyl-tRNA synthetase
MKDLPTRYEPSRIEDSMFTLWQDKDLFHAEGRADLPHYSVVIPPPNITGVLHMGHALNNTIQDILVRWKRLKGFETLWLPGTDHAGIATQNVVEKYLAKDGVKRHDLGREKFTEKVWQWKEEYGSTIINQLKRLGCSCDWKRERFTMDEGLSEAVKEVFIRLYEEGLIYKGDYIINWCPRCSTALSDEEAEHRDLEGMIYYIKYPVKGSRSLAKENEDYIVVATTRPETMLGDVAVAVNPKDERYAHLKGKVLELPIIKRELRVIFDESVDPEFGTGALKVTPAHDPVDFEMGTRHGLENINVMEADGTINHLGGDYEGMDRFECREVIVEELKKRKLFVKSEKHVHAVGHCYRCHVIVEPRLSKQWFVRMKPLAEEAITVVENGKISFYPARWTKVYLNWMHNIRDWCISRQIWWGHRIPVWYCVSCAEGKNPRDINVSGPGGKGIFAGRERPDHCPFCGSADIVQDPDVLDTWFSSWLWPFSTMGWPGKNDVLGAFYPTNVLVTAQEIIFFWVARMIMAGLKFAGGIPFSDVYIHGTVRDSTGTKMSKSLGNVIDPLDVIKEVGADALRFSIISITSQGQDVFLSKEKFEIGRNFANKIWNASRYVMMSSSGTEEEVGTDLSSLDLAGKWILHNLDLVAEEVNACFEKYKFNDAASHLYDFIWHKYCDWYLEISKLSRDRETANKVLLTVLRKSMQLLHPIMPFLTEAVWQMSPGESSPWITVSDWPELKKEWKDEVSAKKMETLISCISAIRNIRAFWNIAASAELDAFFSMSSIDDKKILGDNSFLVEDLASCKVSVLGESQERPEKSVAALVGDIKIFVPLGALVDVECEKQRVTDKINEIERYLKGVEKKLLNRDFVAKAPSEVVEKEKNKIVRFRREADVLKENLEALV